MKYEMRVYLHFLFHVLLSTLIGKTQWPSLGWLLPFQ